MDLSLIELTVRVAVVATLLNLPIALAISWLLVKRRIRGRIVLDALVSLPLALPPVTIGFFLLLVLGREGPLGTLVHGLLGVDIVFTWIAAALASAVVSFPLVARTIMVAMGEVDERLEMSARSLGAGAWRVALTVTIPLAYRGILAGVLLGFIRALSEFGATIMVAGNIPRQDSNSVAGHLLEGPATGGRYGVVPGRHLDCACRGHTAGTQLAAATCGPTELGRGQQAR